MKQENPNIIRSYYGDHDTPPILSILICSLFAREESLSNLLSVIETQLTEHTEYLLYIDSGEVPTGTKRNELLEAANGEYCAFVDDDDLISYQYCEKIIEAIKVEHSDVIGIVGEYSIDNKPPKTFIHSLRYPLPVETPKASLRPPHHLNPVKTEIALKAKFPPVTINEDVSMRTVYFRS